MARGNVELARRCWDAFVRQRHVLVLGLLVCVGGALRFATLGDQSYWGDEALTVSEVRSSLPSMLALVTQQETTPPLYFICAWVWCHLFGSGEVALRSLSALVGTAVVPLGYALGSLLFSKRVGLVTAALAAVNPFLIWYSQEARAYSLLIALCGLSLVLFVGALEGRRWLWSWAIVSALALMTHFFAVFPVAVEAGWLLVARRERIVRWAVAVVGSSALALLPLALIDRGHGVGWIGNTPLIERVSRVAGEFAAGRLARWSQLGMLMAIAAGVAAAGLLLAVVRMEGPRRRRAAIALAVGGATVLIPCMLALFGEDYVDSRNVSAAWLPIGAVVAATLSWRRLRVAGVVASVALVGVSLAASLMVASDDALQRPDWRSVAADLGPPRTQRAVIGLPVGADTLGVYLKPVEHSRAAAARDVQELALVDYASLGGKRAGCHASRCPRSPPPAPPINGLTLVRLPVRRTVIGHFTVSRWKLTPPMRISDSQLRRRLVASRRSNAFILIQPQYKTLHASSDRAQVRSEREDEE
jgi:4-amino-4-deoxy-L-arabinose transferase-like glycosyltransferase